MLFVYLTLFFWLIMILYWIVAAMTSSQTTVKSELLPLFKLVISALITYLPLAIGGWFAQTLLNDNMWTNSAGVLLCATGVSVAVWARHTLGRNWSGRVTVQQEHHVVDEGPYGVIRHPIYSGLLLAMVGVSLVLGYAFSFAYVVFSLFGLVRKSKQEERLLTSRFPGEYERYRRRTKALIPYVY